MQIAEQGDILELSERKLQVLVLSKDFFNRSGLSIVCPFVQSASEDALHIPVETKDRSGIALCEQLKTIDLARRHFRKKDRLNYPQIQEITDAVQSIFDYYPYG